MKLQTNASNGIMGMDFILVIYLVITVSFAFWTAVLTLTHWPTDCSAAYLKERFTLRFLYQATSWSSRILLSIYMYVRKRNSKIQQWWNSSISQRLSPFLRITATEQAILLHNGENNIVTSGDSDSACPVSINTNWFGVVIHFFHPRCTHNSTNHSIHYIQSKRVSATSSLNHLGFCPY